MPTAEVALQLYVAGASSLSQRAIASLTRLRESGAAAGMPLEVIDIYQQPELAVEQQIVVTPTLLCIWPDRVTRVIGDLSDEAKVRRALGLEESVA